jgi:hypothetical protein
LEGVTKGCQGMDIVKEGVETKGGEERERKIRFHLIL